MADFKKVSPFSKESGNLNVIIETPKNSRNKYSYDENLEIFRLAGVLPAGFSFPYDFGFIPKTLGGDGDPLDVLVLTDEPTFTGCLVLARIIGIIEAEQTECDGTTTRNDRLIAVAETSKIYGQVKSLKDLDEFLVDQIEGFFVFYNESKGKKFKALGRFASQKAKALIEEGINLHSKQKKRK